MVLLRQFLMMIKTKEIAELSVYYRFSITNYVFAVKSILPKMQGKALLL
jgi:hypothetical protein